MDRLEKLRQEAQRQANEYGLPVLLIEDPPAMPVNGFKSVISYCTLADHASAEEKQVAIATFWPKGK